MVCALVYVLSYDTIVYERKPLPRVKIGISGFSILSGLSCCFLSNNNNKNYTWYPTFLPAVFTVVCVQGLSYFILCMVIIYGGSNFQFHHGIYYWKTIPDVCVTSVCVFFVEVLAIAEFDMFLVCCRYNSIMNHALCKHLLSTCGLFLHSLNLVFNKKNNILKFIYFH